MPFEVKVAIVTRKTCICVVSRSGFWFLVSNMCSSEEKVVAVIMVGGPTKGKI